MCGGIGAWLNDHALEAFRYFLEARAKHAKGVMRHYAEQDRADGTVTRGVLRAVLSG